MKLKVTTNILTANEKIAEGNEKIFAEAGVFVLNLMSSPGAGKTTLLEQTIARLKDRVKVGVIEGDIAGADDAMRIDALGVPVVQINTGGACHLDANMINEVLGDLPLDDLDILVIENVGNLVCPAAFDLGEDCKVVIASTTEGEDKPIKYPRVFREASLCLLNKIDLVSVPDFDRRAFCSHIQSVHADLKVIEISAKTGEGMNDWLSWIQQTAMQTNKTQPC